MYYVIFTGFQSIAFDIFLFFMFPLGVVDICIKIEKVFVFEHRWADGSIRTVFFIYIIERR